MAEPDLRPTRAGVSMFAGTAFAYAVLEVVSRCMQAGAIFILASTFSKEQFGGFYTYFTVYQLVPVLATAGLVEAMMRRLGGSADGPDVFTVAARRYASASLLTCMGIIGATIAADPLVDLQVDWLIMIAAVVGGAIYGAVTLRATYFTLAGDNPAAIKIRGVYFCASFGIGVACALLADSAFAFYGGLLGAGVAAFAALASPREWIRRTSTVSGSVHSSAGSGWFVVPTILNWMLWYGVVLVAARRFGSSAAADVAVVNNAVAVPLVVHTAVSQAWLSRYLRRHQESWDAAEQRNAIVYRVQSVAILAVVLAVIGAFEFAKLAGVPVVLRYANVDAGLILVLFALSISSPYFGAVNAFAMSGRGRELALISIGAFAIAAATALVASSIVGVFGLYVALAVFLVARGFAVVLYARRRLAGGFFDLKMTALNAVLLVAVLWYYGWR